MMARKGRRGRRFSDEGVTLSRGFLSIITCAAVLIAATEVHAGVPSITDSCEKHTPHSYLALDQPDCAFVAPPVPVLIHPEDHAVPFLAHDDRNPVAVSLRWNQRERSPPS